MIEVNGQKIDWHEGLTVSELLKICKFSFPLIIVKVNNNIVAKNEYDTFKIPDEAKVNVIHLMSGG